MSFVQFKKGCEIFTIEWTLKDGRFAMSGTIKTIGARDIHTAGQCIDEILKEFPNNKLVQRMHKVWKRWHLNDMNIGSLAQEQWLRENPIVYKYPETYFDKACEALAAIGLNPDNNYKYGSAWLKEELPAKIVKEIESWSLLT